MPTSSVFRAVLTRSAISRLLLGWGSYAALAVWRESLSGGLPTPLLFALLAGIVAVILVSSFGVVTEAEHLAKRLGDPYGTLVLTLSIVLIEVILIASVMLGPGEHATIGRDSVMAVSMIILNLVVGASLVVGGLRHGGLRANTTGVSNYLSLLVVLTAIAFALPATMGLDGAYTTAQAIPLAVLTVLLYGTFLARQMGPQRADFQEVQGSVEPGDAVQAQRAPSAPIKAVLARHRGELTGRTLLLIAMVLPIVLLSQDMAMLLDDGLDRIDAPVALSGILIAMIVFLPETITAIRAASAGELQRVSNLCHGALVSTVGLTIPAVLIIGILTGQTVTLGESPTNLLLLGASLMLTLATFSGRRATAAHGLPHLFLFAVYCMTVFV